MAGLQSQALQDLLRSYELRIKRLEQDSMTGLAIPFAPEVVMTGAACTQGANVGYWARFNDVLFVFANVVIGATVGTGVLEVRVPGGILLDDFADEAHVGGFHLVSSAQFDGWVYVDSVFGTDTVRFAYTIQDDVTRQAWALGDAQYVNAGGPGVLTPKLLATGDRLTFNYCASVADP